MKYTWILIALIALMAGACSVDLNIANYYDSGMTAWDGDTIYYLRNLFTTPGYLDYYDLYVIDTQTKTFQRMQRYNVFLSRSVPVRIFAHNGSLLLSETKFLLKLGENDFESDTIMHMGFVQYSQDGRYISGVDEQNNALLINSELTDTVFLANYADSVFRFNYDFESGNVFAVTGHMDNQKRLSILRSGDTLSFIFGSKISGLTLIGFQDMKIENGIVSMLVETSENGFGLFRGNADNFPMNAEWLNSNLYNLRPDGRYFEITTGNEKINVYNNNNILLFSLDLPEYP